MNSKVNPGDRIAKILSRRGICSRREAEKLILQGKVRVNGTLISSPALNLQETDLITVNGKTVGQEQQTRLWRYHKPLDLVTSTKDEKGRITVFEALPDHMPKVMSIGRLDINSEGLLLLTNDGQLKRNLELPSTGWVRKYRVRVRGRPTEEAVNPLKSGIKVGREHFKPMDINIDKQQGANAWLSIGIREGKNREIRRALEYVGFSVNRLIRIGYGPFRLLDLKPGEVVEIKRQVIKDQIGKLTNKKL
ncbi:MAG: pseudouridine synthase [Flavobacteriales bacterium]|nr:pseudouridine synthase [Flavobacteriales bacterium]MAW64641.1 pseudouridine synthase [Flavobacteriales bacterium]|tara:strand:+ start:6787 stop:7533 length:747 start_codon:yes stop_codon:yes gene_type:complete